MPLPIGKRSGTAALLAAALLATIVTACGREREYSAELFVFGTVVEVKLWGASREQADQAFTEIQAMFQRMHRDWHAWEPGQLVGINGAFARGESVDASPEIIDLIRLSQSVEEASAGCFNPAIGALIEAWGFHTSDYPILGPPPDAAVIDAIVAQHPSTRDIRIDGLQLSTANPSVQLDFGGIAKGYAVDRAVEALRNMGIRSGIVNAGGDLRAFGRHGDRPWRVAVRKPGGGTIGAVDVRGDEALFTSGNYERFRQDDAKRYPHILDPRSGWPVQDLASATVITGNGALADAAATALIVAGAGGWADVARALGLSQVLIIDASGGIFLTPDMAARIRLGEDARATVVDWTDDRRGSAGPAQQSTG